MSQTDQQQQQQQPPAEDKSMDKKEIAEEEREKMLNEENSKHTANGPAADDAAAEDGGDAAEQKPRKKIPIGGIKIPGFCRSKSKEPCKVSVVDLEVRFFFVIYICMYNIERMSYILRLGCFCCEWRV